MMISSGHIPHGPYRATKLWNEVVRLFQVGMPTKKHRYLLKTYSDCFTGSEAVNWLHSLLKANGNFGSHVTRTQTIQLMKKFLKNKIVEDIQGNSGNEDFQDNGQLYKFPEKFSPAKLPLALRENNKMEPKVTNNKESAPKVQYKKKEGVKLPQQITDVHIKANDFDCLLWKKSFMICLKRVLHLHTNDDEVIPTLSINQDYLKQNTQPLTPNSEDDIPCWILSAMKCLASWPNTTDSGLPCYDGFERDVFKAVLEYFQSLNGPLICCAYFDLFSTILVRCEFLDEMCRGDTHAVSIEEPKSEPNELERIRKQLMQAQMRHENMAVRRQRSVRRSTRSLFTEDKQNHPLCSRHSSEANNNPSSKRYHSRSDSTKLTCHSNSGLESLVEEESYFSTNNRKTFRNYDSEPKPGSQENNSVNDYINLSFQQHAFNQVDCDGYNSMCSSVEDLLLDMSINTRNELEMKLMGEVENTSMPYMVMQPQSDAFSQYNSMESNCESDGTKYSSLPRPSRVKLRNSDPKSVNQNRLKRQSWCGGPRTRNDIIARREVPPHNVKVKEPEPNRLPYVSGGQNGMTGQPRSRAMSKSYSNLSSGRSKRLHTNPRQTVPHHTSMLALHNKSIVCLNTSDNQPDSPLTNALTQARRRVTVIDETSEHRDHTIEAFQLCLFLIPPANRRRLHLLLRLLSKVVVNPHLIGIDAQLSTKALIVNKFAKVVIRSEKENDDVSENLSEKIFTFMLDHASVAMATPQKFMARIKEEQNKEIQPADTVDVDASPRRGLKRQYTFCKQVSKAEYEQHNKSPLHGALGELLQGIITNNHISIKDKKKKLKQFQKSYPDIFRQKFPQGMPKFEEPLVKKQQLFTNAFQKLKNLRYPKNLNIENLSNFLKNRYGD